MASLRMQTENLAAATERADKAESQVRQLEAEADAQGRHIALLEVGPSLPQHAVFSKAAQPHSEDVLMCL